MLHVLSVAYRLAPVRADAVGGAEQILSALDLALVAAGQRSTVLACEGSSTAGSLCAVPIGAGPWTDARRGRVALLFIERLERLVREHQFDVIHFHGVDVARYPLQETWLRHVPKLCTLHLPVEWYPPELFSLAGNLSFNTVSDWQRDQLAGRVAVRAVIPNGVDLCAWRPCPDPAGDYFVCLGRICHEKGFDRALRAARHAGVSLVLAGQTFDYDEHQRYFSEQIAPLLDSKRRFIGAVHGDAKRRLLGHASAVIVPSRVAETCSLVTLEALSCGTPVIVSNVGAPASFIEPGVTGWVAADDAALVDAMLRVRSASRAACRHSAERFDMRGTAARYLVLYAELAGQSSRPSGVCPDVEPQLQRTRSPRPEPHEQRKPVTAGPSSQTRARP